MRKEGVRRYIKFTPNLAIAALLIAIITWAVVQKPVETPESSFKQENQVPFDVPPLPSYG